MKVLVIRGNRFFGKRLIQLLLSEKAGPHGGQYVGQYVGQHADGPCEVTILNRGNFDDGFGNQIRLWGPNSQIYFYLNQVRLPNEDATVGERFRFLYLRILS